MKCSRFILVSITFLILLFFPGPTIYAHFEHFTHYNNGGDNLGDYYAYQAVHPQYVSPGQPSKIMFSIQDSSGNDIRDVNVLIEIYDGNTGERIKVYPWSVYPTGDFEVDFTFPEIGPYQLVLSLSNMDSIKLGSNPAIDPPRNVLSSTTNCGCQRVVFNISVSQNFGSLYNSTIIVAVFLPLLILGTVLGLNYRRKKSEKNSNLGKIEILRYCIMLLAIAGGLVHFAIYSEHASLRIQYSIFLITAGASQIVYGVLFILLTLKFESIPNSIREQKAYYRKTLILNLFGLIGSLILIGLYSYTLVLPPPISPNTTPEEIELSGILAKSTELVLVVGIAYIIHLDRKKFKREATAVF
jgi:hypothetical protein